MQSVRGYDDHLIASVFYRVAAVEERNSAVSVGAVNDFPVIVLMLGNVKSLHILSYIVDNRHKSTSEYYFSVFNLFCP